MRGAGRTDGGTTLGLLAHSARDGEVSSASWTGPHDAEGEGARGGVSTRGKNQALESRGRWGV